MKKLNKIIILTLCIYMAICQINNKIYSYSKKEILSIIEYQTVEENGEPTPPYVEINADDLKEEIEFPVIQAGIDYVLFGNSDFSNINLLGLNLNNKNKMDLRYTNLKETSKIHSKWINLSNLTKKFLKLNIYIATAALLPLLIYLAVIMVKESISKDGFSLPGEDLKIKKRSIRGRLRDKIMLEQWVKSVALIPLIILAMNLVITFADAVSSAVLSNNKDVIKPITVYIKAGKNSSADDIPNLPEDLDNLQAKDLFSWGEIAYQHTDQPEGLEAQEYIFNTIGSLVNIAHAKFPMKKSLVIAQVVLESGWVSGHDNSNHIQSDHNNIIGINAYAELTSPETTWAKKGSQTVTISMPHDNGATHRDEAVKHYDNLYDCVEDYMGQFIFHHPQESFGDYNDIANYERYIHGYTPTKDAGRDMFIYYQDQIKKYNLERFDNMPDTPVGTKGALKTGYFNTNLEGLYMMESQYRWEDFTLHNLMYIVCGIILTFAKWVLFFIFLVRVGIIFILMITAPIIIIIDAIKKTHMNNGILLKWLVLYAYFVFLKPVIGLIYYALTKINTRTVVENPFWILAIIIVVFISMLFSLIKLKSFLMSKK